MTQLSSFICFHRLGVGFQKKQYFTKYFSTFEGAYFKQNSLAIYFLDVPPFSVRWCLPGIDLLTDRFDVQIEVSAMVTDCFFVPVDAVAVRKRPPLILFPLVIRINPEYLRKKTHCGYTGFKHQFLILAKTGWLVCLSNLSWRAEFCYLHL